MTNHVYLIHQINQGMIRAKQRGCILCVYDSVPFMGAANQFCFFLKAGVIETHSSLYFPEIMELVLNKIMSFDLHIDEVYVLAAQYFKQHRIMNQYYGVFDSLVRNAVMCMSDNMRCRFRKTYSIDPDDVDL